MLRVNILVLPTQISNKKKSLDSNATPLEVAYEEIVAYKDIRNPRFLFMRLSDTL